MDGFAAGAVRHVDIVGTLIDFEKGMLDYLHLAAPQAKVTDDEFLSCTASSSPSGRIQAEAVGHPAGSQGRGHQLPSSLRARKMRCWHDILPAGLRGDTG
ncbi:MAG TPA: hypothetical protein VLK85_19190 [Ramlibacter sp.]|nr:hypothetical protein [Ramlibacter sp.]